MPFLLIAIPVLVFSICYLIYSQLISKPVKRQMLTAIASKESLNYHADILNLKNCIAKAIHPGQLEMAEERLKTIENKYSKTIDRAKLQYEINELKRLIGLQEIIIGQHPTVLN